MSVLVEPGHKTQYPLNHARILYRNVITSVTADSAQLNSPASAVLTKTTYERWKPTASGDSITGTFTEQVINSIAIAAHSNLTPTIEVRVDGSWEEIKAFPPAGESLILDFANDEYRELQYAPDNEALLLLIKPRLCDGVRVTAEFSDNAPSIGVLMAGTVLEMARPVYGGHSPAMLSSSSTVRPNVSESGEWLGASLIRQGRTVGINWRNLPAKWVRQKWHPFSEALKTSPYVFAWNPLRASADAIYCSSSDVPQPSNSGTRDLMTVSLSARGYSDGTEPVVQTTAEVDLLSAVTFTRASPAWGYNANGDLVEYAENELRIVYDPATLERVGLLIEEARTNLLLWSEAFDNAAWAKAPNASITPDTLTAPDGTLTADEYTVTGASGRAVTQGGISVSPNTTYASTLFVYGVSGVTDLQLYVTYDVTGTQMGADVSANVGEWTRIEFVHSSGAGDSSVTFGMSHLGSSASDVIGIWGAQLEPGAFPTSYIPTVASQVTRLADDCRRTLGAEFNPSEFTLFVELELIGPDAPVTEALAIIGSDLNNYNLLYHTGADSNLDVDLRAVGGALNNTDLTLLNNVSQKVALSINTAAGQAVASIDGETFEFSLSGSEDFTTTDVLALARRAALASFSAGFSDFRLIPRAYSAEELADLTT